MRIATTVVLLVILVLASRASSQPPRTGSFRLVVFVEATPAEHVAVSAAGGVTPTETNQRGSAELVVSEGEHLFDLAIPAHLVGAGRGAASGDSLHVRLPPIGIVANHEVEVIVSLDFRGRIVSVNVESPAPGILESAEPEQRDGPPRAVVVLSGTVFDRASSAPVQGARVFVRGATADAESAPDGTFALSLPVGTYDLVVIHGKYSTFIQRDIAVAEGGPNAIRLELEVATPQLEDFVVTAPHIEGGVAALASVRKDSKSVDDVIGAEEMARTGDSDAAGALRRVTGITVVGGQYVYVRGMGERYSTTLLNGQAIPSPEPERRVIPLDLFSTDVLESVVIQKTPSADTPAEFGGGVVQLRTIAVPKQRTVSASVSSGYVSTATLQAQPSYRGGAWDWAGIDDGTRALPAEIRQKSPLREGNRFEEGLTPEELAALGRLLPVRYNVTDKTVAPNLGVTLAAGDRTKLADIPVGAFVATSYGSDYAYRDQISRRFVHSDTAEGGLELNNDFRISELTRTVGASAILVMGVEPKKGHEIRSTSLLLRVTDNETAKVTGRSDDLGQDIERYRLRFVERQLFAEQLAGTHSFGALDGAVFAWRYAFARADRSEPDRREYFYADESADPDAPPADFQIPARPAGNQRIWNELDDTVHDLGADYTQNIALGAERLATFKLGGSLFFRSRAYDTLRLTLRAPRSLSDEVRRQMPDDIWAVENLSAESGWILEDTTQPTDAYAATQRGQAAFVMGSIPVTKRIELTLGARLERSKQEVTTFAPFSREQTPLRAVLDDTDVLPSINGKWQLSDDLVLRAGYGRTVTRPDFRELSESQYRDVVTATRFVGNPELSRGTIDNADVRAEYYFSPDEIAAISGFYKHFDSPIEQVDLGGVDRSVSWDNAESARNLGVELELRRRLGILGALGDSFYAAANLALIRSQVTLDPEASGVSTSQQRALQGQSPYVVNLQLGYEGDEDAKLSGVLLYNVVGPRIRDVGRLGTPDIFEEPQHQLDAVASYKLSHGLTLKVKAKNLLDPRIDFTQGDRLAQSHRSGRTFAIALSWSPAR